MLKQPTQPLLPLDLACQGRVGGWLDAHRRGYCRLTLYMFGNRDIPQPLMRAKGVMVADVGLGDMVEVAQAEAEEMVQAFAFEAANPRPFCLNPLPLAKVQSK